MDSSDEPSVNGPFSNDLDNFNNIIIQYIGTDASLMELHTELLINTTLKPLDTFIFKYRTQDTSTAEEKVPAEYHEYWTSSKKKWNASLNQDYGTMPLKQNPDLNLEYSNHITLFWKNMNNRNYLSRKISRRDTFDHQDHQWLPFSSLSIRKMGNYDQHRIINTSTNGQSKTPTHYHLFQKSWIRSKPLEQNIHQIQCLMGIQQHMHQRW